MPKGLKPFRFPPHWPKGQQMTLLHEFRWFIDALLIIFLVWLTGRLFDVDPGEFVAKLGNEFFPLARQPLTVGSLNAAGLLVITLLAVIIIADPFGTVADLLRDRLGSVKAAEYETSVDPATVFLVLPGYAAFSVFMTFWRERRG